MAHEINNPLAGILQNLQVIQSRLSTSLPKNIKAAEECNVSISAIESYMEKRKIISMIDSARESGYRAADIIKNMLRQNLL